MTAARLSDRGLEDAGRARLSHLPPLDGLRGLAVAAVFLFHSRLDWARGGFLGVSAFFTLSGFLITTLLLVERDGAGRIGLKGFWGRRARRLLPAAFVALGGIVLYGAFVADAEQLRDLRGDVFAALAYVANWRFVFEEQSYAELFNGTPSPVLHFWSLAIEEQFYLVFPIVAAGLLRLGRGSARFLGFALAALAVGSIVVSHVLVSGGGDLDRAYYGTDARAAELLVGALLAVVLVTRRRPGRGPARIAFGVVGIASLAVLLVLWSTTSQDARWLYQGGFALHAVLVAAVIGEALLPGPLSRVLALRPFVLLGLVSYGVYLYHWPVFLWLSPERLPELTGAQLFVLRALVTLSVATLSFFLIERPVRLASHGKRWWPRVAAPVALAAIVVGAVVVRPPSAPPEIVFAPISKGPPPDVGGANATKPGAPVSRITAPLAVRRAAPSTSTPRLHRPFPEDRPIRVLVVGDSVGQTLGRGLELWGNETGRAQVFNDAHYYCSLGRFAPRSYGTGEEQQFEVCDAWGERWPKMISSFDPDVVVLLFTFWEMVGRDPPGVGGYVAPGDPVHDDWQLGEYVIAADTLSANGAKLVWLTMPCWQTDQAEHRETIDHMKEHQLGRLAERRADAVRVVDLDAEVCPGGEFRMDYAGVEMARPDGAHFSDDGARAVANWLMGKILAR
jgi:peptidoglycan/LPS O-acetylase OafA/YrhL